MNEFESILLFAKYKQRTPDPGVCTVVSIDWEAKTLSMTNGACRYFPSFDEVERVRYDM